MGHHEFEHNPERGLFVSMPQEMSRFLKSRISVICALVFLLFLFIFAACSSSTEPVVLPEDLTFQYTPTSGLVTLFHGDSTDFSVATNPSVTFAKQWNLNANVVGTEPAYHFEAVHIGIDTLRLESTYSGVHWNRTWYVNIVENSTTTPPEVASVSLDHGNEAGDVEVSWHMIPQSTYPIEEYQVAMSYDGAITSANWTEATLLGSYPHLYNQVGYSVVYSEAEDGMLPGEVAWFAVRALDEVGQMSALSSSYNHLISSPWFIEGYVFDDNGEALSNVIISYGCPSCRVNSDSEGRYVIGPLPNVNTYDLTSLTSNSSCDGEPCDSFYDFIAHDVTYDPEGNYDIMLLGRYGLDDSCENYDLNFMTYFREMTRTVFPTSLRPTYELFKWESYPVKVYVPPFTSVNGLDYESLCKEVVGFWNVAMGEEYLQLVDSPEEAMIELYFGDEGTLYAGRTFLAQPNDEDFRLGDVIPEKVLVYVWDQLPNATNVQETTMHELGHSLGLFAHTVCSGDGFIMSANHAGILANGPENAVHPDEKRAVRAIRNLPQGTDISAFDWE